MFHIFVKGHFSAAHHLRYYPGNCERPHGHNWNVEITVKAKSLDSLGMGVDFRIAKKALGKVLATLDHHDLNTHKDFESINPSSENIARFIHTELNTKIKGAGKVVRLRCRIQGLRGPERV